MSLGLAAMCEAVEPGGHITSARRLGGGLGASTLAVDIRTRSGTPRGIVLKKYPTRGTDAAREWRGLELARKLPVPSPAPLAIDAEGQWFGTPALVMTRLLGRAQLNRVCCERYLSQIASAMARIHGASIASDALERFTSQPSHIWAAPDRRPRSALLASAQRLIEQTHARESQPVLIHGDFHSGNLLWYRGRLSGVVDWLSLGYGPRAYEVANCRSDLALLSGWRAADRLLSMYVAETSERPTDLALWDVYCGLIAVDNFRHWITPFSEQGLTAVSAREMRARLVVFVGRAYSAFNAQRS